MPGAERRKKSGPKSVLGLLDISSLFVSQAENCSSGGQVIPDEQIARGCSLLGMTIG